MGDPRGFIKYERRSTPEVDIEKRISDFSDFHLYFDEKTQREQASRCMSCGIPYCQSAMKVNGKNVGCPLSNLIPEWNHLVYMGLDEEAFKRLKKTAPFPEFTGSVCPALCEACCSCSINGDAVSIRANERFLIEKAFKNGWISPNERIVRNGLTACVVGSGPSGLSCAKRLNDKGYSVTVYEKNDRFGGLLMYGIPNMKLDKKVVERRIELLEKEGITFIGNTKIGKDITVKELSEKYDEVVFACGTSKARSLDVKKNDIKGIVLAVDFLTEATKSYLDNRPMSYEVEGKNVIVVGGGDTGNDLVGTCVRLKAKSITQLEIMPEPPMENTKGWPNYPDKKKTDYGVAEANQYYGKDIRLYKTTIDEIIGEDQIEGVYIKNVESVNGKFVDVEGSRRHLYCDLLLISMGFTGTSMEDIESYGFDSSNGRIVADGFGIRDNIHYCGDMKNGQSLVVIAIKDGLDCANEIIAKNK